MKLKMSCTLSPCAGRCDIAQRKKIDRLKTNDIYTWQQIPLVRLYVYLLFWGGFSFPPDLIVDFVVHHHHNHNTTVYVRIKMKIANVMPAVVV